MDRRTLIGSLALGILVVPRAARAQPVRKIYRIGILALRATTSGMTGADTASTSGWSDTTSTTGTDTSGTSGYSDTTGTSSMDTTGQQ